MRWDRQVEHGGETKETHKNCVKNLKEKTILKVLAQTGEYH